MNKYLKVFSTIFLSVLYLQLISQDISFDATNPINLSCDNGSIETTINSSIEPLTFEWTYDDGSGPVDFSTDQNVYNLRGDYKYCVMITDALCRTASQCFDLVCCKEISDPVIVDYCSNDMMGSITFDSELASKYRIDWTGPNGFTGTGYEITKLKPGDYTVTFDNERGCVYTFTYTVSGHNISYSLVKFKNPDCTISGDQGEIEISVNQTAIITWFRSNQGYPVGSPLGVGPSISVGVGEYIAVIETDDCTIMTGEYRIVCCEAIDPNSEESLISNVCPQWISMEGACDGSVSYEINLPTWRFKTIRIINTDTGERITSTENLCAGSYCITVNDGCVEDTECFTIQACDELQFNGIITHTCPGVNYGEISIWHFNGTEPFQYSWSQSHPPFKTIRNLPVGLYSVTVTDKNGCTGQKQFPISPLNPITEISRNGCTLRKGCNNRHVPHLDEILQQSSTLNTFDCTYTNKCSDGYLLPPTDGEIKWEYATIGCKEEEYCEGVRTGRTRQGTITWKYAPFGCVEEEYCNDKKTGNTRPGATDVRVSAVGCAEETYCVATGITISTRQVQTKMCKKRVSNSAGTCQVVTYCPLDNAVLNRGPIVNCNTIFLPWCTIFPLTEDHEGDNSRSTNFNNSNEIKIYPNPFESQISIEFHSLREEEVNISLSNTQGKIIYTQLYKSKKGLNILTIKPEIPTDGIHFIDLKSESINERKKLLKIN